MLLAAVIAKLLIRGGSIPRPFGRNLGGCPQVKKKLWGGEFCPDGSGASFYPHAFGCCGTYLDGNSQTQLPTPSSSVNWCEKTVHARELLEFSDPMRSMDVFTSLRQNLLEP